jgi:hypothetical protein
MSAAVLPLRLLPSFGEFLSWTGHVVEDALFARWVEKIEGSGNGKLSPSTILALAFLVCEPHAR